MRHFFIAIFIFLGADVAHSFEQLETCEKEGRQFGITEDSSNVIRSTCSAIIKQAAPLASKDINAYGDLVVFGHRNFIFYRKLSKGVWREFQITGANAMFDSVEAIKIDERTNSIVAVTNGNSAIFTYLIHDYQSGNVIPNYQNISSATEGVTNVTVLAKREQVVGVFKDYAKLVFFNREACKFGRIPKKSVAPLREISGANTLLKVPLDIAASSDEKELFVLEKDRILVFSASASGDVSPLRIISLPQDEDAVKLKFNNLSKKLLVYSADGSKREVEL